MPSLAPLTPQSILAVVPSWLRGHLHHLQRQLGGELYLAGGVVRDLLLGKQPQDIDLTVSHQAQVWAARLAELSGGALVPLGRQEDAARVVAQGLCVDIAAFRQGARAVAEDLVLRDLTINAMAIDLRPMLMESGASSPALKLIDPTTGWDDLQHGLVRLAGPTSLVDDPLRMVRVFRFAATLGFAVEAATLAQVRAQHHLIARPAVERINHELDLLLASGHGAPAVRAMVDSGLLGELLPELMAGQGMEQPASHHLDVFDHSLAALAAMEQLAAEPEQWFPQSGAQIRDYVAQPSMNCRLCWAALLHDVGKPATYARRADKNNRITFYQHDQVGVRLVEQIAHRYRWSNEDRQAVCLLIGLHMRPFFLANDARGGQLSLRACIRLLRKVGNALPGLMLLAMADSLAGKGEARVEDMEGELANLFVHLLRVHREHVAPVQAAKPLINGNDLINRLGLRPGPIFSTILDAVQEAQMEGRVSSDDQALALAGQLAHQMAPPASTP